MQYFFKYLRERMRIIILSSTCIITFIVVFILYEFPIQAILYPALLCLLFVLIYNVISYKKYYDKHKTLESIDISLENIEAVFSSYSTQTDKDYQAVIRHNLLKNRRLSTEYDAKKKDMLDYYTLWVHQIKTPIASMSLTLENDDTSSSRKISEDLFRIEQYVSMVLTYLRLNSLETDYVFEEISLEGVIKESLRKFAPLFINKQSINF